MIANPLVEKSLVVGVVGLGVGEQHAAAYANELAVSKVLLCDSKADLVTAVCQRVKKSEVAFSFDALLANHEVDIISIATFDDAHYCQVVAALSSGKHVFVEKPLCRTINELGEIKRLWANANGKLHLGCNLILRTAPLYIWAREAVSAGEFGEIYAFDGDYLYGRLHKVLEGWRGSVPDYSVMLGGGIHLIDLLLWISRQRPISVVAAGNRICTSGSSFRYNDFCSAMLRFDSGMIARMTANYGCVHRHQHVMRIFGTRKTLIFDDAGARLHDTRDASSTASSLYHAPLPTSKGNLIPGFIATVLGKNKERMDPQGFFDGLSVAIACDRAAASGKTENIEYV